VTSGSQEREQRAELAVGISTMDLCSSILEFFVIKFADHSLEITDEQRAEAQEAREKMCSDMAKIREANPVMELDEQVTRAFSRWDRVMLEMAFVLDEPARTAGNLVQ
jgi:hypothetical protein